LRVTAQEWQTLSPLVDVALDIAVTERRKWVESLPDLSRELREKLFQLVAQHGAPETQNFLETLPSLDTLVPPRDSNTDGDWRADDVIGSYTLIYAIGHGGMGDVWLAKRSDGAYQRNVALKLPSSDAAPARIRERMLRERDVLASLEHANIARFYDAGVTASGQPFIAMEYVEGDTLSDHAKSKKLSVRDRCKLFLQVLSAVQFAHQRLVVHRDLKPSNIQVRNDGQVALLDFGVAKVLDETSHLGTESQLTRDTGRALTLAYAAPEQVLSEPISTTTDIFSAGVLFYELLSGVRPFAAHEKNMAAMIKAYDAPVKPMSKSLGSDLNAIVAHALRREPNNRYESAAAFADDIKRYLDDQPVVAVQGARWYSFVKFVRRQRVALVVGSTGVTAAAIFALGAWNQHDRARSIEAKARSADVLLSSLLNAVSPENAATYTFTAKEILDRSLKELDADAALGGEPQYIKRLAELYEQIGEFESAKVLYERELTRRESDGNLQAQTYLLTRLAHMATLGSQLTTAHQYLDRAEAVRARDDNRLVNDAIVLDMERGRAFRKEGRYLEATMRLQSADKTLASLKPMPLKILAELRESMGHLASASGDLTRARSMYEEAATIDETPEGRGDIARLTNVVQIISVDTSTGFYDRAVQAAEIVLPALRARTGESNLHVRACERFYAHALLRTGNLVRARDVAARIEADGTRSVTENYAPYAKLIRLSSLMYQGNLAAAETELAQMVETFGVKKNDLIQNSALRLHAESILRQGRTEEALAILRISEARSIVGKIERRGDIAAVKALIGISLFRQGQFEASSAAFQESHGIAISDFGANHPVSQTTSIYLQLIAITQSNTVSQPPLELMKNFAWQPSSQQLSEWFTRADARVSTQLLPVVF
jgi:eukaryotic-like serine/threonine-protein kinase